MAFSKKIYILSAVFFLILLFGTIFWYMKTSNQNNQVLLNVKYQDYIKDTPASLAIENFFEKNNGIWIGQGKPVCAAVSLWEKDITSIEKIVLASVDCRNAVEKNGDLRSDSGFNNELKLYKLQMADNEWVVVDYDDRTMQGEFSIKSWVLDYLKLVPAEAGGYFDPIFLDAKLVKKAGETLGLKTPNYNFNFCFRDKDCTSDEVCSWHNPGLNRGNNKCIKKCSAHQDCGIGYTCRGQCVWGENGCPYTFVDVCLPDLLNVDSDKTGKPL